MVKDKKLYRKMLILRSTYGKEKHQVITVGILTTDGLIVCVLGGEKPHVGAVAVAIPRPSLKNNRSTSATTSVFTLTGHKDDEIAKPVAHNFAKSTGLTTVVIAGLHIEKASQNDIAKLAGNAIKASKKLLRTWMSVKKSFSARECYEKG